MSAQLEQYRQQVEAQMEELFKLLANISIKSDFTVDLPEGIEATPLGDLFAAVALAAENMKIIMDERNQKIRELEQREETIYAQSRAILELSTPVIQIEEGILVLPLIGTIDTNRAQQIVENLLESIVDSQASVVIIDITGVPAVDTNVANHFLKTIEAARMLGAEVILSGVSPHNAQVLVKLGVHLGGIVTKGSLQAGLQWARQMNDN